jgi:hypothetical protein
MTRTVVLAMHIAAGVAGLVLGPAAMRAVLGAGRASRLTFGYQVAVGVLTATAVALAALDWSGLWPFAFLAVATEAAVVGAWWAERRRFAAWRPWRVRLLCGSYVSLVTALLVVSWGSVIAWVLPTVVGTVLIERAAARATSPATT